MLFLSRDLLRQIPSKRKVRGEEHLGQAVFFSRKCIASLEWTNDSGQLTMKNINYEQKKERLQRF